MPDGSTKRHIRLRDFEGPMSGALFFTGYQEELKQYYEIEIQWVLGLALNPKTSPVLTSKLI